MKTVLKMQGYLSLMLLVLLLASTKVAQAQIGTWQMVDSLSASVTPNKPQWADYYDIVYQNEQLWAATSYGLYHYTAPENDQLITPSNSGIHHEQIRCLHYTDFPTPTLWVGSFGGGVQPIYITDSTYQYGELINANSGLSGNFIRCITATNLPTVDSIQLRLLIGTSAGLNVIDFIQGSTQATIAVFNASTGFDDINSIGGVAFTNNGETAYASTVNFGLVKLTNIHTQNNTATVQHYNASNSNIPDNTPRHIAQHSITQNLYTHTPADGMQMLEPTTEVWTLYNASNTPLANNYTSCLTVGKNIWLGTPTTGFAAYQPLSDTWRTHLPENWQYAVADIAEVNDSSAWVCSSIGQLALYSFSGEGAITAIPASGIKPPPNALLYAHIYPNPVQQGDYIKLSWQAGNLSPTPKIALTQICNSLGRCLPIPIATTTNTLEQEAASLYLKIPDNLSAGIYYLQLQTVSNGSKRFSYPIVIE